MSRDIEKNLKNRRKILLGIGSGSALAAWHKPIIGNIVTPAHAQTSPTPADLCPMILIGNILIGPVSGTSAVPVCSLTFDVLSGDASAPLTITSITNSALADNNEVTYDSFGEATDTTGPRVVWRGPASDAPFCSDFTPIDDLTFTVTATCDAVPGMETFSQDFSLAEILASV